AEGKVVISQEGEVEGELISSSADVSGYVNGDVRVEERLLLKSTARLEGNIFTHRLVMEEGAFFDGKCEMERQSGPRREIAPAETRESGE
ncbi:MAG: bactofilin family protein, partial [Rhodothermales bacterium]